MPARAATCCGSPAQVADRRYRAGVAREREIVVRLSRPAQLFAVDPVSPLDGEYTPYTAQPAMATVRDELLTRMPRDVTRVRLVVELPASEVTDGLQPRLEAAVRRWVEVQNVIGVDASQATGAVGRRLFLAGAATFLVLQVLSITVDRWAGFLRDDLVQAVGEGLSVASWVMLWFPVQLFTVEVWQSRLRRGRMRRLERMHVEVRAHGAAAS